MFVRTHARVTAFASLLSITACPSGEAPTKSAPPPPATQQQAPPLDPEQALAQARAATAKIREQGNHLKGQPSPYLEQHAHNPVDWYPWGEEALAKAKAEGKPIFLSIGYSTCHWCHVMEHESFEDDEVAAYLNAFFVAIKVDREQRPDIDALYIDAVSAMGGSTGWPLSVFLTPQLEPFYGGTYFPRHAGRGRPGFLDVLAQVRQEWIDEGPAAAAKGQQVFAQVQQRALAASPDRGLDDSVVPTAMRSLARARDPNEGGFGNRQKFPNPPLLGAELRAAIAGDDAAREHLTLSLDKMRAGGVRDHVSGSFHRYAVDAHWHVPHFERMLYDNAQLAALYIEAGLAFERDDWVLTGRAVLDELIANWRGAGQAFVVGFDADDPGGEGAFYSWTPAELTAVLGSDDAKLVIAAFDVTAQGEREIGGRSVLHRQDDEAVANATDSTAQDVRDAVARALPKMAEARAKRPPPARDDKVLVAWNALAIMALADAGRWLGEPRYVHAANEAALFIRDQCWQDGAMLRGYRGETSLGPGVLDDHALAGLAFVRLHAATGDLQWLALAESIMRAIEANFFDQGAMTFMGTPADGELPVRLADMDDGVLPSGGSAAVRLALELGSIAGDRDRIELAEGVLGRVRSRAQTRPFGSGYLLQAFDFATAKVREVVIAGEHDDPVAELLWAETRPLQHARFLPVRVPADGASAELVTKFAALAGKKALSAGATAYVCERGSCQSPTSDPSELRKQLQGTR